MKKEKKLNGIFKGCVMQQDSVTENPQEVDILNPNNITLALESYARFF